MTTPSPIEPVLKPALRFIATVVAGILTAANLTARAEPDVSANLHWTDIRDLGVEGRGWTNTARFYDSLPARAESGVRQPVWDLSHNSAGMCVRFVTDATTLRARWA